MIRAATMFLFGVVALSLLQGTFGGSGTGRRASKLKAALKHSKLLDLPGPFVADDEYVVLFEPDEVGAATFNALKQKKAYALAKGLISDALYYKLSYETGSFDWMAGEGTLERHEAEELAELPGVKWIHKNVLTKAYENIDTDPTWGQDRIDDRNGTDGTYEWVYNGTGVVAFVLDTGVNTHHGEWSTIDGEPQAQFAGDCVPNPCDLVNDTQDPNGHGTHVAGTIASKEYGVAHGARILSVRVLNAQGYGSTTLTIRGMQLAMDYKAQHPNTTVIINLSLGGGFSPSMDQKVEDAYNAGCLVVVAAGNDDADACFGSPSGAEKAISVAASTNLDTFAGFSNWGSCVDIAAPGQAIESLSNNSNTSTVTLSGTSMACPHVVGALAMFAEEIPNQPLQFYWDTLVARSTPGFAEITPSVDTPNRLLFIGNSTVPTPAPTPRPTTLPQTLRCNASIIDNNNNWYNVGGSRSPDVITELIVAAPPGSDTNQTVWVDINTCSPLTTFDTVMHLFTDRELQFRIDLNDDDCGLQSRIARYLAPGTYWVVTEGYTDGQRGTFQLVSACFDSQPPPPPPSFTGTGTSTSTGTLPTMPTSSGIINTPPPALGGTELYCGQSAIGSNFGTPNYIGNPSGEVIYRIHHPGGSFNATTCKPSTDFDTVMRLLDSDTLMELHSNDDDFSCQEQQSASTIEVPHLPGGNYLIVIEGFHSAEGNFGLEALCGDIRCGSYFTGSNVRAPNRVGHESGDAVFAFHPHENVPAENVTFDTCGFESGLDTYMRVFIDDGLSLVIAEDDNSCGRQSHISLNLSDHVGVGIVFVVVEGPDVMFNKSSNGTTSTRNEGIFELHVTCDPMPIPAPITEEPSPLPSFPPPDDYLTCGGTAFDSNVGLPSYLDRYASGEQFYSVYHPGGHFVATTCRPGTSFDTVIHLLKDTTVKYTNDDDWSCPLDGYYSTIEVHNLDAGIYTIAVEGFSNSEGPFELEIQCGKLDCDSFIVGTNVGAPNRVGSGTGDAVYHYNISDQPFGNSITFDTCTTTTGALDTFIQVYSDEALQNLIASNDDFCGNQSLVALTFIDVLSTESLYVVVGSNEMTEGTFTLNVTCDNAYTTTSYMFPTDIGSPRPTMPAHPFGVCQTFERAGPDFGPRLFYADIPGLRAIEDCCEECAQDQLTSNDRYCVGYAFATEQHRLDGTTHCYLYNISFDVSSLIPADYVITGFPAITTTTQTTTTTHTTTTTTQQTTTTDTIAPTPAPSLDLCNGLDNLAPNAQATSNGGGVGQFGPAEMNDEEQCDYHWPRGAITWIQYNWTSPVRLSSFVLLTDEFCEGQNICVLTNAGRGVASGDVEWWDGANWVRDGSFANNGTVIEYTSTSCIETTGLRITDMRPYDCGQATNPVVYEWSVCECPVGLSPAPTEPPTEVPPSTTTGTSEPSTTSSATDSPTTSSPTSSSITPATPVPVHVPAPVPAFAKSL